MGPDEGLFRIDQHTKRRISRRHGEQVTLEEANETGQDAELGVGAN